MLRYLGTIFRNRSAYERLALTASDSLSLTIGPLALTFAASSPIVPEDHHAGSKLYVEHRRCRAAETGRHQTLVQGGAAESILVECREYAHYMSGIVERGAIELHQILRCRATAHHISAGAFALLPYSRQQGYRLDDVHFTEQDGSFLQYLQFEFLSSELYVVNPLQRRIAGHYDLVKLPSLD